MRKVTKSDKPTKNSSIGERIKYIRTSKNMTQDDLATTVYKSRQEINYFENGTRKPDIETLISIAKCLDVSMDYLCGLNEIEKPNAEYQAISNMLGLNANAIETIELSLPKASINTIFDNDRDSVSYLFEEIENYKSDIKAFNKLDKKDKNYKLNATFTKVTKDITFAKFRMQEAFQSLIDTNLQKELEEYNKK